MTTDRTTDQLLEEAREMWGPRLRLEPYASGWVAILLRATHDSLYEAAYQRPTPAAAIAALLAEVDVPVEVDENDRQLNAPGLRGMAAASKRARQRMEREEPWTPRPTGNEPPAKATEPLPTPPASVAITREVVEKLIWVADCLSAFVRDHKDVETSVRLDELAMELRRLLEERKP